MEFYNENRYIFINQCYDCELTNKLTTAKKQTFVVDEYLKEMGKKALLAIRDTLDQNLIDFQNIHQLCIQPIYLYLLWRVAHEKNS